MLFALALLVFILFCLLIAALVTLSVRERSGQKRIDELDQEARKAKSDLDAVSVKLKDAETAKLASEKAAAALKEEARKQERQIEDLKKAMNANSFDGRFPICSNCKDIRDENGCWHSIEEFIAGLSEAEFSHSLCPDCAKKLYPEMFEDGKKLHTLTWK